MRNLLIFLRFKGTNYLGFQVQKKYPTIMKAVQDAIESLTGKREDIKGCSRTDAGVHANMYCINFRTDTNIPQNKIAYSLNGRLPKDIVCYKCILVEDGFHARYYSTGKEYIYIIKEGRYKNPILEGIVYNHPNLLDIERMKRASRDFLGRNDFYSFCSDKARGETIKTITDCQVYKKDDLIYIKIVGPSFLMHMVRIMVGTLIEIGDYKKDENCIKEIMKKRDRKLSGITAPAHGLYLNKVFYKEDYSL